MDEQEKVRARQEALTSSSRASRSAERARLWAGLNRYLATETEHEHRLSDEEGSTREPEEASEER